MLPLFDTPAEPAFRDRLAARLGELAVQRIYLGASSWKYEGWLGQIYGEARYRTRGRFSQKKFESECLQEYAEVFPAVCGDFSFYQFPTADFWRKFFTSTPPSLRCAFKVPEAITVKTWPSHARYGQRGGQDNEWFLDVRLFDNLFLKAIEPWLDRTAVAIFEFGTFNRKSFDSADAFLLALDDFLRRLPPVCRYAVEVRNPEYLTPEYFACLAAHRAAHVFNAWTRMPPLEAQIEIPGAWTTDFTVTRALLRRGRTYEQAVKQFSPYAAVQDPYPEARDALRRVIRQSRDRELAAYIFVNNRLEGNAPGTIAAVVEDVR